MLKEALIKKRGHPNITSKKGWLGGLGQKKWQFLLTVSPIYADVGWVDGWVGQKKSKKMMT